MPQVDPHRPGTPSWIDLHRPDPAPPRDFYAALLGSKAAEVGGGVRLLRDGPKG